MYFFSLVLLTAFVTYGNLQQLFPKDGVNYGSYKLNVTQHNLCSGVKLQGAQAIAYYEQTTHDKYVTFMNITFLNNLQLTSIKVFVYRGSDLSVYAWKYIIKNPCDHPVTASILKDSLDIDRRCIIKKGHYSILMPVSETASGFLGNQFFYGAFSFKSVLFSKNSIISCSVLTCVFTNK